MNGPLTSIAHDLKFEGDTIMEGFVVSTFLVGAFIGSVSGGVLADKVGRRRTFQIDMLPLIVGAALRYKFSMENPWNASIKCRLCSYFSCLL
jgi:MFS family permease